jgi:hypothetical protein
VYAPAAAALQSPPNPNRALDAFLVPDPDGDGESLVFDDVSWLDAARASISWDAVSWLDGSWADAAWSDVSWSDVSWSDVSWADVQSNVYGDVGP